MNKTLEEILQNNPAIWRAGEIAKGKQKGLATGFSELDAVLPDDGWPLNALIEIITPRWGLGELKLLLPLLLHTTKNSHCAVWISPPYVPYAPALHQYGVALENMIVMPDETIGEHCLWVLEKVLRTQACGVAIAWPKQLPEKSIRRLQLAAEQGRSLGIVFRNREAKSSPAALRIRLTPLKAGLQIDILKARGGSRFQRVVIPFNPPFIY